MGFNRKESLCIILYIMFIAVEITLSQTSIETKISMLRQMIISNETIYVGGVGGIASYYKENMTEMSFNANYSNVWLLLYDEKREELIQCNEYYDNVSHCSKQTASLRNTGIESTDITVDMRYYPTYKMIYTNEVTASIVVIGANSAEVLNTSYGILSFNLKDFALFKTKPIRRGPMNIERNDKENLTLTFKSTFSRVSHFYFLFQKHANNQFETSRMGKLCITFKDKDEIERYKTGYYHSYEDMNITCEYNGRSLRKIENTVDEGGFVIFLFFHNEFSVICAHSWAAIEKDYLKSRKSLLLCGRNTPAKNGRYFEPDTKLGTNIYEHCFHNKTYCDKGTYVCRRLEGDICNITYHHTLVGGKGIENMDDVFDINKTITALDILQTSGFSVLYFGTKDGQLGMIGKIDINDCSIHKDCESCMNSFNSSCGWDYDENRCNVNNSYSSMWISSENGNCIHFSNITGHIKIDTTVAVSTTPAYIDDLQYTKDDNQFSFIVGLLTGGLVTSIIIGITAVIISRRNTNRAVKKCKMEMSLG